MFAHGKAYVEDAGSSRFTIEVTKSAVRQVQLQVRQTQTIQLFHRRRVMHSTVQLFT